ncbi:MAG: hypothetical protein ACI9KE_004606 [Polyangiales bacterium]|jgi:hypothetical protein
MKSRNLHWCVLLSVVYWVAIFLVDPRGDFPTNDDWGYAPAVESLALHGQLRFTDWQSMPLLSHVLTGSLFATLFGYSYEVLRLSTLCIGWLGVLCLFGLARQLGATPARAGLAALVLAANPLYLGLCGTFMTDVPFAVATCAACWAWLRSEERVDRWYVLAIMLAVWATMSRQLGLAMPLAWGVTTTLRYRKGGSWMKTFALAWAPLLIVAFSLVSFERIIASTIGLPALYAEKSAGVKEALFAFLGLRGLGLPLGRTLTSLLSLGLFAFPLLALGLRGRRRWAAGAAGALVAAGLVFVGFRMPFEGNIIIDLGMGPRTLAGPAPQLAAPAAFWIGLSVVGGFAAGLIVERILTLAWGWLRAFVAGRKPPERESTLFWVALIAFAPTAIAYGAYFDRYLLLQLPLLLAFLASRTSDESADSYVPLPIHVVAVTALGLLFLYSVGVTHDYFAWQRARWELVAQLEDEGVPRTDIDGGFEVNNAGARAGEPFVESRPDAAWLIVFDAATVEAPAEVRALGYAPWMPWAPDTVYAVEVGGR